MSLVQRVLTHTTHFNNLESIIKDRAILCPNARRPDHREIWSPEIVARRAGQLVSPRSQLTLGECVAAGVTSKSAAHLAVATGHGVKRVRNDDLIHVETCMESLISDFIGVGVADRNPLARGAKIIAGIEGLAQIDWGLVDSGNFSNTRDDPNRTSRMGAEALIRGSLPLSAVDRIVCSNTHVAMRVKALLVSAGLKIEVVVRPQAFFNAGT